MCKRYGFSLLGAIALLSLAGGVSSAQVLLPDSSSTSTMDANVSEQCHITVPTTISFSVHDITTSTASDSGASQAVTINYITLLDGNQLQLSIQADAATFTAPTSTHSAPSATWACSDVSWSAATWTGSGTGTSGAGLATSTGAGYQTVATSSYGATECSTTNLVFTLAAKNTVERAGTHTLGVHWMVASITP